VAVDWHRVQTGSIQIREAGLYLECDADDLSDCFQFNAKPSAFRKIIAPHDAKFFLNYKGKLENPDDD
jgi:hypothetical protein